MWLVLYELCRRGLFVRFLTHRNIELIFIDSHLTLCEDVFSYVSHSIQPMYLCGLFALFLTKQPSTAD